MRPNYTVNVICAEQKHPEALTPCKESRARILTVAKRERITYQLLLQLQLGAGHGQCGDIYFNL